MTNRPAKVLIVDDSEYSRSVLCKILEDNGLEVVGMAESVPVALRLYDELRPDVVTMDLVMPDGGGLEGIQELMQRDPNVRIVVISAVRTGPELEAANRLGVAATVTKPARWPELQQAFAKALA